MPGSGQHYTPGTGWSPDTSPFTGWAGFAPAIQTYALAFATQVIWSATGRQFGTYDTTIRPCYQPQLPTYVTYPAAADYHASGYGYQSTIWGFYAFGTSGAWWTGMNGCGCSGGGSGCGCAPPEFSLPGPVASIDPNTGIVIDGVAFPQVVSGVEKWRLDGIRLVREDGQPWPRSQDLSLPDGQVGTWHVQYQQGVAVPAIANTAAGLYAFQVAKALSGGSCALPQRVQSIARQGVNVSLVSDMDFLKNGRTGLVDVDILIVSLNPHGLKDPPRVLSLDLPQYR